jgi:aspartyl-tRNA(Asn)/glutamyl-tRNA(Gln) amidotransferase subunit A
LSVLAGQDEYDATSLPSPADDYQSHISGSLQGLKIGLPQEFFSDVSHPASRELIDQAINSLEELGAQIVPVSLPHTKYGIAVYYIITPAELSSNLGRFDGIRYGYSSPEACNLFEVYNESRGEGFGPEAKRRIMLGTYALSAGYYDAYYKKAQKVRTVISNEVKRVFNEVDVLATPVSPHPAIRLGEKADDPLAMYLEDVYMETSVMAGIPGLSVPAGFVDGLPVGLQLMGPQLSEATLLSVAHAYEKEHEWVERYPSL